MVVPLAVKLSDLRTSRYETGTVPPMAPIAAEKCWHNIGTYNQAQGQTHQRQIHAKPLLGCRVCRETPVLQSGVHSPGNRGLCESCQLSIAAHGRIVTVTGTGSGDFISSDLRSM